MILDTGLGFANTVPGFSATVYKANTGSISNVSQANAVISTPAEQSWTKTETAPYVNYMNTGGGGEFSSSSTNTGQIVADRTYPGMTIGTVTPFGYPAWANSFRAPSGSAALAGISLA